MNVLMQVILWMLMQVLLQMLPHISIQILIQVFLRVLIQFFPSILVLVSDQASLQVFYYTCQTKRYQQNNNNDDTFTDDTDIHMIGVSSLQFLLLPMTSTIVFDKMPVHFNNAAISIILMFVSTTMTLLY